MTTKLKRAAIYARYSSKRQKDTSVEDQIKYCENYAERLGGIKIVATFCDRAKTATTMFGRDGMAALKEGIKRGDFEMVIAESQDRMARDTHGMSGLWNRLKHRDIELWFVNEGQATTLSLGLRNIISEMGSKDIGDKVKRGLLSAAEDGKFPGIVTYGYERIEVAPGTGIFLPGERRINEAQAVIIRRIFTEYVSGASPRQIAEGLTRDKIPTPRRGLIEPWNKQTILGGGGGGIIGNQLYIGKIVWGKQRTVTDPDTNAKSKRNYPVNERVICDAPHLRIVPQDLWEAAQRRREVRAIERGPGGCRPTTVRCTDHILSGLLRCGVCHGNMVIASKSRGARWVKCAAAHMKSACEHGKMYKLETLQALVFDNFRSNMVDPERIKKMVKAHHDRYVERTKEANSERLGINKKIATLTVQIDRLADVITQTDEPIPALVEKLNAAHREKKGLLERMRLLSADTVVELHPAIVKRYMDMIDGVAKAFARPGADLAALATPFRTIMDSIVVLPTAIGQPYAVDAFGRLSALTGDADLFPKPATTEEILEEEGLTRTVNGKNGLPVLTIKQQHEPLISLGRWKAAA